jgi:antitoxin (DNA-binding transcriptional repressor) of toxin-antitoxin stability system
MPTITLEELQASLPDLISKLQPGVPRVITRGDIPVARLLAEPEARRKPRKAGSAKGLLMIHQEDDEHLEDFKEYME